MGSITLESQDPDETLDHVLDWQIALAGGTIAGSSWEDFPAELMLDQHQFDDRYTQARISVNTAVAGDEFTFTNRVVTAGGEVIDQRCRLRIING